jgi:hypothetical protein
MGARDQVSVLGRQARSGLDAGRRFTEGFRGSRVQIPRSRLRNWGLNCASTVRPSAFVPAAVGGRVASYPSGLGQTIHLPYHAFGLTPPRPIPHPRPAPLPTPLGLVLTGPRSKPNALPHRIETAHRTSGAGAAYPENECRVRSRAAPPFRGLVRRGCHTIEVAS